MCLVRSAECTILRAADVSVYKFGANVDEQVQH